MGLDTEKECPVTLFGDSFSPGLHLESTSARGKRWVNVGVKLKPENDDDIRVPVRLQGSWCKAGFVWEGLNDNIASEQERGFG